MHDIDIQSLKIPEEIKTRLSTTPSINIRRYINKGSNKYIFFAHHDILNHDIVINFYYWAGDPRLHKEPQRLKSIEAPNVIKIHHAEMVDDEWAFFITDYCPEGDLDHQISNRRHGIHESLEITRQILNGLSHLHAANLIHQDIKPGNIFLHTQKQVVIGDFGSVKFLPEGHSTIVPSAHSILFTPPESITENRLGTSGDIYQVWIILFQLLGGHFPYEDYAWLDHKHKILYDNAADDFEKSTIFDSYLHKIITKGKLIDLNSLPVHVPENVKKLIRRSTHIDPAKRYSSCSIFMNDLRKSTQNTHNWYLDGDNICLDGKTCYRIHTQNTDTASVEKKKKWPLEARQ